MTNKYQRLADELCRGNDLRNMTFDELTRISGSISPVYINNKAFTRSNSRYQMAARSVGFTLEYADYENRTLRFRRDGIVVTRRRSSSSKRKKPKIPFAPKTLSNDDALKIVIYFLRFFESMVRTAAIPDKYIYFRKPDAFYLAPTDPTLDPIGFIYKELAMHGQNGGYIANDIRWRVNEPYIDMVTDHYNPTSPLAVNKPTFVAHFGRTSPDAKKRIEDYYGCLSDIRTFLNGKANALDVYNELTNGGACPTSIRHNLQANLHHRFGTALTFDFIKEFGRVFGFSDLDYPKPDLHIKRNVIYIFNRGMDVYLRTHGLKDFDVNSIGDFDAMRLLDELVQQAKVAYVSRSGVHPNKLDNYLMDKFIYIIGSGKFYLDGISLGSTIGETYTRGLANEDYLRIPLTPVEITELDTFLGGI